MSSKPIAGRHADLTSLDDRHLKTLLDIGDIVGVTGPMKRTDKGELSIVAQDLQVPTIQNPAAIMLACLSSLCSLLHHCEQQHLQTVASQRRGACMLSSSQHLLARKHVIRLIMISLP